MTFDDSLGQSPGLKIWRIEDFEAVPYDESKYGQFYTGDSYIILKTTETRGRIRNDIFFWLGSETSQDEAGTAAIKSVELDDRMGGAPVQHREVQGHESSLFESCFKKGIKYLPGGIKSGFKHVDPDAAEKRLFQVKGKRNIKVLEVAVDASVMNKSDCFILDLGKGNDILVYMPPGAKKMEKFRAIQAANGIRDEDHAGNANVEIIDEFSDNAGRFFEELGSGDQDSLPEESGDDSETEAFLNRNITLYKVSDSNGDVEITEISGAPLKQEMLNQDELDSKDCYILDTGSSSGIFAWIGKGSSKDERIASIKSAEGFLKKHDLPNWTKVERIVEGGETTIFKQYFNTWKESDDCPWVGLGRKYPVETIAEWDVASLHAENRRRLARAGGTAIGFMPDNGLDGTKEIWRIEDMEMVPLDESLYGMFFGGDSYVIKYSYTSKEGRAGYIVYFWQGAESSQDEKAASAICAVKLDDELGGKAVQVRVVQGQEPRHFIKMFGGKMIVFSGGKASGFKNIHDHDTYDTDGTRLFRVRGTCPEDVRVVQVEEKASSLNSEDVFILETKGNTWIWNGRGASEDEKSIAVGVAPTISPDVDAEVLEEGAEPDDFWNAIGGQGDYSTEIDLDKPILDPRLFHCYNSPSGKFRAIEVNNYEKDDLVSDDVMILDSGDEIYVWIGNAADASEKENGLKLAKEYLAKDPTKRNEKNTLIMTVKEGEEPSSFTCLFPSFA